MRPDCCKECGSLPVTKQDRVPLECAVCGHVLCDGCALIPVDGEDVCLSGDEVTDEERRTYPAFCEEHEGRMPARRDAP
ncbi:hypothetical protein [Myxococcus virescens]|uniref:Uncharacterized protein n=1 Tax=Myxococcus virescens TaxID=83456 RepID=A0A511HNN9_9BACT|nr:hypothetical protein [Myxococcus virescens]GEL75196.1 hypothetical protein MVI01_69800 [Myxococcus virescens]SDD64981.1 hypothetical protein SAMN04488504_102121 [Myxococcus virescens]